MGYNQVSDVSNEEFRHAWVKAQLAAFAPRELGASVLLDVGAGASPYKEMAVEVGFDYFSHDFSAYVPNETAPGLQSASWEYPDHDYVCDITQIPLEAMADVILCTEVLEHVPDPVRAFQRMALLLRPGGKLIVTVPFLSLMHQSPFWFQSGLSPFWFEYWANEQGLAIETLKVQGDYVDLMAQELNRLLTFKPRIKGLGRGSALLVKKLRGRLPDATLQSGAFGTLFVGSK